MENVLESQGIEAPAWVQDLLKQMQQVVVQQDQKIQGLQEQLQAYTVAAQQDQKTQGLQEQQQAYIDNNSAQSAGLTPATTHSRQPSPGPADQDVVRQKDRLAKPPEFHGDRAEFRSWLLQVRAKITVDLATESETVRFWYVHGRLRGKALAQVESWVTTQEAAGTLSTTELVAQLKAAYDDRESAERASRKLNVMRQGKKAFPIFLAEFDRTILDAGGVAWDDQVKKTFLSNCLSPELKTALVATPVPASYREYCILLHTVSANLEALEKEQRRRTTPSQYVRQPSPVAVADVFSPPDTMDWEPVTASAAQTHGRDSTKGFNPPGGGKRRCYRCNSIQHLIRDCPVPPLQQQARTKSQTVTVASAREALPDDSEEQGKE
jgi:uncharacterized protein YfiM (DUF2279 family)